jgi:glycosyltransferase involved in cell wall biosynthesis
MEERPLMLVSVIIPTYNRTHQLLNRSLASVLRQTHQDLEVIIVADGMEGPLWWDLRTLIKEIEDARISLHNIDRQVYPEDPEQKWCLLGMNARNYGLDTATGEWIAPLDDDDEWTDDHVEVLLREVVTKDVDFAYGQSLAHWEDERESMYGDWPPGHFQFCDGAQLYRNGMGYRYDPTCIERGLPEDGDLWDRMVDGGVSFAFLPQIVHHYYPNPR